MATRKFKMILAFYLDTKRLREWRVLDGRSFTFTVYQSPFLADILITFTLLKAVFHFNRIVAKRSVCHCFANTQAELVIWTQ